MSLKIFHPMITRKQNTEFGIVVSLVFLILSIRFKIDLYVLVAITLLISLLFPKLFTPFAWIWFRSVEVLEPLMSKILLFLIFFFVVTPIGQLRKMLGNDSLHIGYPKNKKSMFENKVHTYKPEDLERQF